MRQRGHENWREHLLYEDTGSKWFFLSRVACTQQMPIAVLSHPFGSGQMTVERMSRTIWLSIRINMQHDPRDLSPVGTLGVGIEQPQIGHQMFHVVVRQCGGEWHHVGHIGIKRGFLNRHPGARRVTSGDNVGPLTKVTP